MKKFKEYLRSLSDERLSGILTGYNIPNPRLPDNIIKQDTARRKAILNEINKRNPIPKQIN